ncbi:hypothetical protein J6590_063996 [Homalodisca vitripennis]|nr:hypothetical protein J6590_063996 [Homalodisca vitripennis]
MEYSKLEKVEVGGLNGRHLSSKVAAVFDEFNLAFNVFRSVAYDPVEPEDPSFLQDYKVFKEKVLDYDRRMAAISSLAFNECHNCDAIFKMINVWDTMLKRPIIKAEITPKFNVIIDILNNELDTVRAIYNEQMELYEENGFITVDTNWPPVAGGLVWILKMINRISHPVESFKQFENPIVTSPEGEYVIVKYDEMTELLGELEEEIFNTWCEEIPQICNDSLTKTLLLVDPDTRILTLNFDKEFPFSKKKKKGGSAAVWCRLESSDDLEKPQVKISALENDEKLDLETSLTIAAEVGNALLKENEEKKKELHDLKMLMNNLHTECEDKIKKIEEMNKLILEDKDSELREKILEIKFKDNKLKKEVEIRNNLCLEYEESNRNTVNKMLKLEAALKLEKSLHAKQISTNKCLLKDLKTKDITLEKLKMESNNLTVTESSQSTGSKLCCHRSNQSEMKQAIEIMEQINQDLEDKIKNEKGKNEVLLGKIISLEKQLSEKSAEMLHLQSTIAKFSLPKNNTFPKVLVNNSSQTNQEKKEKKITKINLDMYDRIKCLQDALLEKNQLISNIENSKNSINESESNINSVIGKNIQAGEVATLTILSDSHGRHLNYHLKKINSTVSVKSCVIPGANLDRVMSGASDLVKNRNNFVTLIAGANDIYNGQINTFLKNLRPAVMALKPCKILIGTIPFRRDLAL